MKATPLQLDETNLMSRIASKCRLDAAFNWLRKNKQKASPNDLFLGYGLQLATGIKAIFCNKLQLKLNIKICPSKQPRGYSFKFYLNACPRVIFDRWVKLNGSTPCLT